jgi:hypothetical protein
MRRALGLCLALSIATRGDDASADPSAPQLSPVHLQREDAQRLADQQRRLDRDNPPPATMPGAQTPAAAEPATRTDRSRKIAGGVLLGVAGVSALVSLPLLQLGSSDSISGRSSSASDFAAIALVTAVVSGLTGIVLLSTSKSTVQLAPTVTPNGAGVSLFGRL